jgi:hypothetical protein
MQSRLRSFAVSAKQVLTTGGALVERKEYDQRLAICATCNHRELKEERIICALCGCNMHLKARFVGVDCPYVSDQGERWSKWTLAAQTKENSASIS